MKCLLTAVVFVSLATTSYASDFKLESTEFNADGVIPQRFEYNSFGCTGDNKSPALKWTGAPKGTKSFAVTVYDPDAPSGSGWWHWLIINIPAQVNELASGAGSLDSTTLPNGAVQG